jgi:hypothetical protein
METENYAITPIRAQCDLSLGDWTVIWSQSLVARQELHIARTGDKDRLERLTQCGVVLTRWLALIEHRP